MVGRSENRQAFVYADTALEHLKRHRLSANPRSFELWYAYAAGFNRSLNAAVDEIVLTQGEVTADDLQHLYSRYLSPERLGERIEEVGGRVEAEIEKISSQINASLKGAESFNRILRAASAALSQMDPADDSRRTVDRLLMAASRVEADRLRLEEQLAASRQELDLLQVNLDAIRYESSSDELTTLASRKHFDQAIEHAIAESERSRQPLSLLLADIDNFKSFNDRYGHQIGDQVLRLAAFATKQNVSGQDIACRYGGEEFAIILPSADMARAQIVGEHIRQAVMTKELVNHQTGQDLGHLTVSIGIATHRPGETAQTLIGRADACLYAAKRKGRNCVVCDQ